ARQVSSVPVLTRLYEVRITTWPGAGALTLSSRNATCPGSEKTIWADARGNLSDNSSRLAVSIPLLNAAPGGVSVEFPPDLQAVQPLVGDASGRDGKTDDGRPKDLLHFLLERCERRRELHAAGGHRPGSGSESPLVVGVVVAERDPLDAEVGRRLGHLQEQDVARREPRELPVVGRNPVVPGAAGTQPELRRDQAAAD